MSSLRFHRNSLNVPNVIIPSKNQEILIVTFQKLTCTEQDVIAALEVQDPTNQFRIAYNLILDNKSNRHIG